MSEALTVDLESTYLAIQPGPEALPMKVTPEFWATIEARPELGAGARMLALLAFESDWSSWEMHPAGDEVLVLLSGAVDLILERGEGPQRVSLRDGACAVVPRGVWHTADVVEPARVLHLTLGQGTEHRPR
ncbi:MAG: cupin domain-containing protein [Myxococcota bacterium]